MDSFYLLLLLLFLEVSGRLQLEGLKFFHCLIECLFPSSSVLTLILFQPVVSGHPVLRESPWVWVHVWENPTGNTHLHFYSSPVMFLGSFVEYCLWELPD